METATQITEQLKKWVSPWVYGPIIFILWVLLLNLCKRFLFERVRKSVQKTPARFDHIIIETARFPLTILILGSGIYILQLVLPLEPKWIRLSSLAAQGFLVLSAVLFFDLLIRKVITLYFAQIESAFISRGIVQGLIRGTILGLGLLIFLDIIGISITPLLASLGIGSLAVALALQDTLTNLFAGIYITIDRPIQVGDFVKLESGEEGYVTEIGWRATRVRMLPDYTVIVPNQKIMSSILTNYYLPTKELAVSVEVRVHYDSDLKKVEVVTTDVARQIMKTVKGAVPEFEPFIRYHTFDSSSVNFTVILRGKEFTDQYFIKHEFVKALHERYKKEGIVIPYPISTLDFPKSALETLANR